MACVVDAEGTVHERRLELGPAHGDRYLVEDGLEAGERIVLEACRRCATASGAGHRHRVHPKRVP